MSYRTIHIKPRSSSHPRASVLVIYTGGTFGMVYDQHAGQLVPFDFERAIERLPELHRLDFDITLLTLPNIIDSSNMKPEVWVELAQIIQSNYATFDSFVILHGTDTMSYTASALSFMLVGLNKPVILTGAQLPIGVARSDARENFLTALEIAAAVDTAAVNVATVDTGGNESGNIIKAPPMVPEVCVYFNSLLLRGNRSTKRESVQFNAFVSENYPHLATAGVSIDYNRPFIQAHQPDQSLTIRTVLDPNVAILKLFPGITSSVVDAICNAPTLHGIVLETFGAGNAPTDPWLLETLKGAIDRGVLIFNVSQCEGGRVTQGQYQTSVPLVEIGVVSGADITTEAAITKLMVLLGSEKGRELVVTTRLRTLLAQSISGEMSE
ncbi:asparaginase [Spirosoma sp. BT702]|uniref:asparaginase n=1 Tax=Spirosoma profusum TaxID=2771354 RepID=A0A926XYL4_9BACT|nr:asparaginase [Spirosoma profusum]MBD2703162.1 asparaginase [Spirosoma profusum]